MNNKFNTWPFSGSFANLGRAIDLLACEQQTYFRSSLLSLRQPEMRLLFSGYRPPFVFRMWVIWCSQGNSPFVVLKVIRTYAREYNEIWKKQLASDPVQTYPDIFESATFSFRIKKCPPPHVSIFKSILPVHTYPIPTPLGVLAIEHASCARNLHLAVFRWARFCYVTGWKNFRI